MIKAFSSSLCWSLIISYIFHLKFPHIFVRIKLWKFLNQIRTQTRKLLHFQLFFIFYIAWLLFFTCWYVYIFFFYTCDISIPMGFSLGFVVLRRLYSLHILFFLKNNMFRHLLVFFFSLQNNERAFEGRYLHNTI